MTLSDTVHVVLLRMIYKIGDGRVTGKVARNLRGFGWPRKLTPHQAREAVERVQAGEPLREIALSYAVDHSTISRLRARHAAEMI